MSELLPRITGTEIEYQVEMLVQRQDGLAYVPVQREAITNMVARPPAYLDATREESRFLSNGGKLYRDYNDMLEYATPEDASFWGTVTNELAAEKITQDITHDYAERQGINPKSLRVSRRVVTGDGLISWGYHENYFMPLAQYIPDTKSFAGQLLGLHLATRQVYAGAGLQLSNGTFALSQKFQTLADTCNAGTTANKPLLNTRDESHAQEDIGKRVHIISGDPTMSPWATFMKLATTSLVLRLIESSDMMQTIGRDPMITNPNRPLHELAKNYSSDITLKLPQPVAIGKAYTALDVQEKLVEWCLMFAQQRSGELPQEELSALAEWQMVLRDLRNEPLAKRNWEIDWVAKYALLNALRDKHGPDTPVTSLMQLEHRFNDIVPPGVALNLHRKRVWRYPITDKEVDQRTKEPPTSTRAFARGNLIREGIHRGINTRADWGEVTLGGRRYKLLDPYDASRPPQSTQEPTD